MNIFFRPRRPFPLLTALLFFALLPLLLLVTPAQSWGQQVAERDKPTLLVGIPANSPPLAFLNDQGTAPRGMAVDLAVMMGARLKCEVRFIQDSPEALRRRLYAGNLDFLVGVPQDGSNPDDAEIIVTPFDLNRRILVSAPEAHVTCEQDYRGRKIIMLDEDPSYQDTIVRESGKPIIASSYQEAISLLTRGEGDAFVARSGEVASYVAQRMGMSSVRFMGLSLERSPVVIETRKNDPELVLRLHNALNSLGQGRQFDMLRDKWLGRALEQQSFWELYRKAILSVLGGGILVSLLVMFWIIMLRREVRRTTRSLQSSERRYRELTEGSPDMTLLLGTDGSIRLANRIARQYLGLTPETEPGSMAMWNALCEEGRVCFQFLLKQAEEQGRVREEIILNPDSGEPRIMEFIAFPTSADSKGDPLICCIGRDMTERRRLDQELIEVERLAVIGQTAAGIAHEINNPLGIIMAHTDVALSEPESEPLRAHLEAISRNVERAATSTRRLLNMAMPQSINIEPQNLSYIIREAISFLRPRLKNIKLDTSALQENLEMAGDKTLLEQLFVNLLLNAVESMNEEGALAVSSVFRPEEQLLEVRVWDNGPGIPPENLEKIFDPFFTTRGSRGFGLGLYISRRIAEAHKGRLHAESSPGQGTQMIVTFKVPS